MGGLVFASALLRGSVNVSLCHAILGSENNISSKDLQLTTPALCASKINKFDWVPQTLLSPSVYSPPDPDHKASNRFNRNQAAK
jgi:hypothetical protein